jgi:broad specificity phosphatase PhoE
MVSANTTTLYIARHGQSEMNNQRLVTGQLDPLLTPKGIEQSEQLARLLAHEPLAAIYTSALARTAQTAAPTARAHALEPVRLSELNEIHLGVLQGRHRDERDDEAAAIWQQWQSAMWRYRVPGAESFAQLQQRVGAALTRILAQHQGETVLIVGHSGTNRILLGTLLAIPAEQWPALRPSNKTVHRITLRGELSVELSGERTAQHSELSLKQKKNKHDEPQTVHVAA